MLNQWSLIRAMIAGAILSLAAMGAQADPEEPVSVSDNASEQGKMSSAQGIQTANEARGTVPEEEDSSSGDTSDDSTSEDTELVW